MKFIEDAFGFASEDCDYVLDNDTHFSYLEVFERHEDDKKGTCVRVNADGSTLTNANMRGNLSLRRTSVVLHFEAEQGLDCDRVVALIQHKGKTYVNFMSETEYQNKIRFGYN